MTKPNQPPLMAEHDREPMLNTWRKCRKRPIVVEARNAAPGESVATREGTLVAQEGDLIIRGVEGECYPIGREIFAKTYEWLDE